jgi:hypothetical protein
MTPALRRDGVRHAQHSGGAAPPPDARAAHRLVLLGASNATRGISTIVATAGASWGRPLEVLAAIGHGRSYGMPSSFLGRVLPGILQCGLWHDLAQRRPLPLRALVTDIGNDIMYGVPPQTIADWVARCIDSLQLHGAHVVLTLLPEENARRISHRKFRFFRRLFFPRCTLDLPEVQRRVAELNHRLRQLSAARGVALQTLRPEWYGLDPIHIRYLALRRAWGTLLAHGGTQHAGLPKLRGSLGRWWYLRSRKPQRWWRGGRPRHAPQPAAHLADGTTVAFY